MNLSLCQIKKRNSNRRLFYVSLSTLFLFFLTVGGCGSNGENNSSVPSPVDTDSDSAPATLEDCRQYPQSFKGYRYEWDDEQNAIVGHNIRYNCLARTRIYMNKSDFINEGEVFGLDLAAEYDDIDCMEGGPSFFTNNTFDGSKLVATSYKIDDVDSELYEYTWEVHDEENRPISGSRKVLFEYGFGWEVMCDQQPVRRTYYDEKRMILEERFLAASIQPLRDPWSEAKGFQNSQCESSLAKQYYYTENGLLYAIKWFSLEDIDPDVEVSPPPEPGGIFEVCVE